jgi:hypothetical protein
MVVTMRDSEVYAFIREVLADYEMSCMKQIWTELCPDQKQPKRRADLEVATAEVLGRSSTMGAVLESAAKYEQIAARMVVDCGDRAMVPRCLHEELQRVGRKQPELTVLSALRKGLLLAVIKRRGYYIGNKMRFDHNSLDRCRLVVNPMVAEHVLRVSVPGEADAWTRIAKSISQVRLVRSVGPDESLDILISVGRVIALQPRLLTSKGYVRAAAGNKIEQMTTLDQSSFMGWVSMGWRIGAFESDEEGEFWQEGPMACKLRTEPLRMLCQMVLAIESAASLLSGIVPGYETIYARLESVTIHQNEIANHAASTLVEALYKAASSFLDPGVWFADSELLPLLRPAIRRSINLILSEDSLYWYYRPDTGVVVEAVEKTAQLVLDLLAQVGVVDRGECSAGMAGRLTEIGAWILRNGIRQQTDENGRTFISIWGRLTWRADGLTLSDRRDMVPIGMLLGLLAEPDGPQSFRIDQETLLRAIEAGESVQEIESHLKRLAGPPPESVMKALEEAAGHWQPVVLTPDLAAYNVLNIAESAAEQLRKHGFAVFGSLVLGEQSLIEDVVYSSGEARELPIDYDQPPRPMCKLDNDLVLTLPDPGVTDLRLVQLLEEIGVPAGSSSVKLDPEQFPGTDELDDRQLERYLKSVLKRLQPHVFRGIPDAARTRFLATVGAVAAPNVETRMVLTFDEDVARGLLQLDALKGLAEALPRGRFLVSMDRLAAVEEKLSEVGIPFPAEHSSLRQSARAMVALDRLEEAVTAVGPAKASSPSEKPAETSRPARRRRRPRQPIDSTVAEAVLTVVREASADSRGSTLGGIVEATGYSRDQLRPVLKALVRDRKLTLTGHARGARYTA